MIFVAGGDSGAATVFLATDRADFPLRGRISPASQAHMGAEGCAA